MILKQSIFEFCLFRATLVIHTINMRRGLSLIPVAAGLPVVSSLCHLLLVLVCPYICRLAGPEGRASKHNLMHEYIHEPTPGGVSAAASVIVPNVSVAPLN